MATLTIELSETINQQLLAHGISQQQMQSLITDFVQNYLRQYQPQPLGDDIITSPPSLPPSLPPEVAATLAELDTLDNKALWNIARTALKQADLNELEQLSGQQKVDNPTPITEEQRQALLNRYDQAVLKRARAMAILKQRGEAISPLLEQPAPC